MGAVWQINLNARFSGNPGRRFQLHERHGKGKPRGARRVAGPGCFLRRDADRLTFRRLAKRGGIGGCCRRGTKPAARTRVRHMPHAARIGDRGPSPQSRRQPRLRLPRRRAQPARLCAFLQHGGSAMVARCPEPARPSAQSAPAASGGAAARGTCAAPQQARGRCAEGDSARASFFEPPDRCHPPAGIREGQPSGLRYFWKLFRSFISLGGITARQ